ncbi:hypothetical protein KFE25_010630 [Diacronema lutheri]|uniref:Transcription factor CBF/NF-Y/archaeal histone domain-containing protein n=2 Tax=Diacronema lutheri TaxID=2081491 RepID=A0A8J5XHC4_DIALT|nr:hypothetical protein KFE25_010630 [Diacronema lutheri]
MSKAGVSEGTLHHAPPNCGAEAASAGEAAVAGVVADHLTVGELADAPDASAAEKPGSKRSRPADAHISDEISFPATSIARMVKACIPGHMQLAKDARTAFARSASIFALYVTACANDICREGKRSTISANDVFKALDELEFETFTPQVKEFVEAFRNAQAARKGGASNGEGAGASAGMHEGADADDDADDGADDDADDDAEEDGESSAEEETNMTAPQPRGEIEVC